MKTTMTKRRWLVGAVLAGALALGSATAFVANGAGSATIAASTGNGTASTSMPNATGTALPGGAWYGRGAVLTVTGVSGNTITATSRGGQTVTVQVSATTAYTEAGANASLADVKAGTAIAVQGSYATTSGTTINARGVTILLPTAAGMVTNVSGTTLTLTTADGATHTVTVSASTRYQKAGQSATLADISTGTAIVVEGTTTSNGSLNAVRVTILPQRHLGERRRVEEQEDHAASERHAAQMQQGVGRAM